MPKQTKPLLSKPVKRSLPGIVWAGPMRDERTGVSTNYHGQSLIREVVAHDKYRKDVEEYYNKHPELKPKSVRSLVKKNIADPKTSVGKLKTYSDIQSQLNYIDQAKRAKNISKRKEAAKERPNAAEVKHLKDWGEYTNDPVKDSLNSMFSKFNKP
jgi:hypothetical protein